MDWDEETGAAWTVFRRRLADLVADADSPSWVELVVSDGRTLRIGTSTPDAFVRDADRLAWDVVRELREDLGCLHPALLEVRSSGGPVELVDRVPLEPQPAEPEPEVVHVANRAELQEAVDRALAAVVEGPLRHDEDGDVVIGRELEVLVHVDELRPVVEVYVLFDTDLGTVRLLELSMLNRRFPHLKFTRFGDLMEVSMRVPGDPFVPAHLRAAVARMITSLPAVTTELAEWAAARKPDRRPPAGRPVPVSPPPARSSPAVPTLETDDPGLVALVELLHDGSLPASTVAALFDGNRSRLVRVAVGLRTGVIGPGPHDAETLLGHVRRALRYVVDRSVAPEPPGGRGPGSLQLSLLSEAEADAPLPGLWD